MHVDRVSARARSSLGSWDKILWHGRSLAINLCIFHREYTRTDFMSSLEFTDQYLVKHACNAKNLRNLDRRSKGILQCPLSLCLSISIRIIEQVIHHYV